MRGREPGAVLGAARRRRQLRRRDEARVQAARAARRDPRRCCSGRPRPGPRSRGPTATCSTAGAPDELGGGLAYITGPPEDFVPRAAPERAGRRGRSASSPGTEAEMRDVLAPIFALEPAGGDDRRDALCRDPVRDRRPAGLPQLLVGRAPDRVPGRGGRRLLRPGARHGRALAVAAHRVPVGRRGRRAASPTGRSRTATRPGSIHPLGLWEDPADDEQAIAWARGICAGVRHGRRVAST